MQGSSEFPTHWLNINQEGIPSSLKAERRWVIWRPEWNTEREKWDKPLYIADFSKIGHHASSTNDATWRSFEEALEFRNKGCIGEGHLEKIRQQWGIGFVLTNKYCGIDLDGHYPDVLTETAVDIIKRFETYVDISPSGKGLHLIYEGEKYGDRSTLKEKGIEYYSKGRYFTMTGIPLPERTLREIDGTPYAYTHVNKCIEGRSKSFYIAYFGEDKPKPNAKEAEKPGNTFGSGGLSDMEILGKLRRAKNSDKFIGFYHGGIAEGGDHSETDIALIGVLAFYTQDPAQLDRLFRGSALMREKWDEIHRPADSATYGQMTIEEVLSDTGRETYSGKRPGPSGQKAQTEENPGETTAKPSISEKFEELLGRAKDADDDDIKLETVSEICKLVACLSPLQMERYLKRISAAHLASIGILRDEIKVIQREMGGVNTGESMISIAEALYERCFTVKLGNSGYRTLQLYQDSWFEWLGTHYTERTISEIDAKVVEQLKMYYTMTGQDVTRQNVSGVRLALYSTCIVDSRMPVPGWVHINTGDSKIIALKNGLLHLPLFLAGDNRETQFTPHSPNFFNLSSLPYDYSLGAKCPKWLKFLGETFTYDSDLPWVLQEFFGYTLTDDNSYHNFLFLQGESRTGKSVVLEVLQTLVGLENVSRVSLHELGGPFGLQPMLGKKLNINAEVPEIDSIAEDMLKEISGGNTLLTYNRKHKTSITTTQRPKLAFTSNHFPHFKDRSEGLWARMLLVPFRNRVPDEAQNPHLAEEICAEEIEGVFLWALEGYKRLVEKGGFTDAISGRAERESYRDEAIPVRRFLSDVLEPQELAFITVKELYPLYARWAKTEGHNRQNKVTFSRDVSAYMTSVGAEVSTVHGQKRYKGFAIIESALLDINDLFAEEGYRL